MALSFFTHYALNQVDSGRFSSAAEAFRHCKRIGIDCGDLLGRLDEYPLHLHCELLRDSGIQPAVLIVCNAFADSNKKIADAALATIQEKLDCMEKLGIPMLMLTPELPLLETADARAEAMERMICVYASVVAYAKQSGITIVTENRFDAYRPDATMADMRKILDCVPGLGYVLDSGNFSGVGESAVEAYALLKDRTVHMHCKDWAHAENGEFTAADQQRYTGVQTGSGCVPLRTLAAAMKREQYKGNYCFEHNSAFTGQEFDDSIRFMRETFV